MAKRDNFCSTLDQHALGRSGSALQGLVATKLGTGMARARATKTAADLV